MRIFSLFILLIILFFGASLHPAPSSGTGTDQLEFGTQLALFNFWGMTVPDINHIWVCGGFGTIAYSGDRGKSWKLQKTNVNTELYDIVFLDEKTGWSVGRHGLILSTIDGGNTWVKQDSEIKESLFSLCFVNSKSGWAVGEFNTILHTGDGGITWEK